MPHRQPGRTSRSASLQQLSSARLPAYVDRINSNYSAEALHARTDRIAFCALVVDSQHTKRRHCGHSMRMKIQLAVVILAIVTSLMAQDTTHSTRSQNQHLTDIGLIDFEWSAM